MKVMRNVLAAVMALTALAAPVAAQDSSRPRQLELRKQARPRLLQAQRLQREQTAQERARAQRLARQQAQREATQRARQRAQQQRAAISNWPVVTEAFTQTLRLGRNGTFELQNAAGNIIVNGGGGDEVRIDAIKSVRHRVESSARAALTEVRINVMERGGNVEVRTEQPRRGNAVSSVEYTVAVPRGASVVLQTVSGDVRVTNIGGELRAQSASGSITAASVRRVRELRSVSGTIDVSDGESDELTAHTLGGDVLVRNLKGRVLDLQTVTGDVRLMGVEVDRARLESMAGDLDYSGRLARNGRYEFQTHSGDIRLSPSGNTGFDLQATSFSGALRSEYELKVGQTDSRPPGQALHGSFGDAAAVVTAQSFSGDVLILKR